MRFIMWMVFAALVVLADQASKGAIIRWVPLYGDVPINGFIGNVQAFVIGQSR